MKNMDNYHKNRLQEYCQSNNIALPRYLVMKESDSSHIHNFQVKVQVDGRWYVGHDRCSSKREAEQSAAENAWRNLVDSTQQQQPALTSGVKREEIDHFSKKYADVEQFIVDKVERFGGQIQTIWAPDVHGRYKVEITGAYRYCENVKKDHKKCQIYFLVNPVKKTYYQKCYHRKCLGFRSSMKSIVDELDSDVQEPEAIIEKSSKRGKSKKKKSLRKNPCRTGDLCGHAIVCAQRHNQDDW